jgi:DNA-binding HxlR family transcriptional regulator
LASAAAQLCRRRSDCPVSFSLDIFGDKWTLLVIRDLLFVRKTTYGQFLDSPEKIATNILAQRLAWLEKHQILTRSRDPHHRQRRIYRLTRKGRDLLPILLEMIRWGAKHDPQTAAPPQFLRRLRRDRAALIREILARQPS